MNKLKVFLKHPNKKNVFKMTKEVLTLMIKKKEIPYYYIKYLYRKSVPNYLDYIGFKEQKKLQHHKSLHNPEYTSLIDNKLYFSLFSEKASIKTPKLLSYNFKSSFFYNNDIIQISSAEVLGNLFNKIFENNNTIEGIFFRPPSDYGGKGCFKITKANFKTKLS